MQTTTIATSTDLLKALRAPEHPYYHSSQYEETYPSMADFLDAWKNYDIDLNRVIRWDITDVKDDFSSADQMDENDRRQFGEWGSQYADIHFVAPRKGHTFTNRIQNLKPGDIPRLYTFLKKHWEHTQMLWDPIPHIEYVPPTTPRSRFLTRVKEITDARSAIPAGESNPMQAAIHSRVTATAGDILALIDNSYVLMERPEDEDMPLDPGLNIAGELAKTYFDEINS